MGAMRIASLSPAATEILHALGLKDQIVCRDQFSNFPEEAKAIPAVMGHQEIKAKDLRTYEPEIVLTETVVQRRLAEDLRGSGFSVVHQDPRSINEIYGSIRAYGALFDAAAKAEELILEMQQGFNAVKTKAKHLRARPRVYVEEWHEPPFASGNWVPEIVRIAGGDPFPIAEGQLSREVQLQEVAHFDPLLLVISWCGSGPHGDSTLLLKREGWTAIRAVKEGRVKVIDDSLLNRPGPRLVEGAQRIYGWLFELLH